ncbi:MAG: hypothetical protein KatS3mg126_1099 [Lysobacteraceae bacterium]|nr:MAG: hypothetical protein KatS3mg126_1099 [Xanthomonadaceae bacterium]
MTRGLLYLGSDLERLYQMEDGHLHETSPDRRIDRLVVVADFVEESLVRVTLPRLHGRDLAALLQRRLEQEFRETPYRAACRLGPSRENPKQVDYIFVGLPIARRLDQRLRPLADDGVALGGLYSVSMLAARLLREAGDQAATRLVLLPTPAGVRFILVQHGQAVLSRLATDIDLENEDAARVLAEELDRTVQYIYNARLVERGQAIDFSLWGDAPAVHALAGRTLTGLKPSPVPGLAADSDPTRHGIAALLRLALRSPPDEQLAPPVLRRFHALALLRKWVLRTGVAAFVVLALVAGHFWFEGRDLRAESAQLQSRRATIEAETQALRDRLAALRVDPRTRPPRRSGPIGSTSSTCPP